MEITVGGERAGVKRTAGGSCSALLSGLAAVVLAIATYFHHVRLLGLFTILATILAVFLGRAIARRMRACIFLVLGHNTSLLSE